MHAACLLPLAALLALATATSPAQAPAPAQALNLNATCPTTVLANGQLQSLYFGAASCADPALLCGDCLQTFTYPWVALGADVSDAAQLVACAVALEASTAAALQSFTVPTSVSWWPIVPLAVSDILAYCLSPNPPPPPPSPPGRLHPSSSSSEVVHPPLDTSAGAPPGAVKLLNKEDSPYNSLAFAQGYALQSVPLLAAAYLARPGPSLRCVDYAIGRDNATGAGDGFSFLRTTTASGAAALAAIRTLEVNSTVTPLLSDMDGLNVYILKKWRDACVRPAPCVHSPWLPAGRRRPTSASPSTCCASTATSSTTPTATCRCPTRSLGATATTAWRAAFATAFSPSSFWGTGQSAETLPQVTNTFVTYEKLPCARAGPRLKRGGRGGSVAV